MNHQAPVYKYSANWSFCNKVETHIWNNLSTNKFGLQYQIWDIYVQNKIVIQQIFSWFFYRIWKIEWQRFNTAGLAQKNRTKEHDAGEQNVGYSPDRQPGRGIKFPAALIKVGIFLIVGIAEQNVLTQWAALVSTGTRRAAMKEG